MLFRQRGLAVLLSVVAACLVFGTVMSHSAGAIGQPVTAEPCNGSGATIFDVTITGVTSTTATVSWQTDPATESCLDLDSAILPIFPSPQPISQGFQGIAYVPGEYDGYLDWVDRALVTSTLASDVDAIASANFNGLVLYPAGPSGGAIHPWDEVVLDRAATRGLKVVFRLEWYDQPSFDWEGGDCDAILDHYDAYLAYFRANPDLLFYFLINMPLDDPAILDTNPTIGEQRDYVAHCYDALKTRVPSATVYANTYYGWRDELHQAPVGDLVDGVSVVTYSQHAAGAPFDCTVVPTAGHPASSLICKDQFDYYLDKAWSENNLAALGKPLVLDSTGFAPAASFDNPAQRNGIVADSWAKVKAIAILQRYLDQDVRLYGWSYFKLLHKGEADWGLIDRRRITDSTITTTHHLNLADLHPAMPYTFTIQAGSATSDIYTFATSAPPSEANVSPLITMADPPYGHELAPLGGELTIAWQDNDPDDDATIGLYYDVDDAGCNGAMIVNGLSEDSAVDSYTWALPTALPTGSYYIYGQVSDGTDPVECDYSSGRFVPSNETLEVLSGAGTIIVDGLLDEPAWQFATPYTYAVHISQTDVTTATVRALWDQDYLSLGFEVEDAQVETAAPETPWDGDSVSAIFNNGEFKCRQDVGGTGEGVCDRGLYLPPCTTLDDSSGTDCGFAAEMRIQWSRLRIAANLGDVMPTDLLSVDHDGNPGAPYDDPGTEFSKLSWDGDNSVDTSGRSLTLVSVCDLWPCIWLPAILKVWP
jgi:hypothetical protein